MSPRAPDNITQCIDASEWVRADENSLALWNGLASRDAKLGLGYIHREEIVVFVGDMHSKQKNPFGLTWDGFLECWQVNQHVISAQLRDHLLETVRLTYDRLEGVVPGKRVEPLIKTLFSSYKQFLGSKGHLLTLRKLTETPAFDGYLFTVEAERWLQLPDDSLRRRIIDIVARHPGDPAGREKRIEVKAWMHYGELVEDWDDYVSETGQFTADLADAISTSGSAGTAFYDLLYAFPDHTRYPHLAPSELAAVFRRALETDTVRRAIEKQGLEWAEYELALMDRIADESLPFLLYYDDVQ